MQRLFTTFAGGWPGFGLLIQRLVTSTAIFQLNVVHLQETNPHVFSTEQVCAVMLALLFMFGLWTPVTGVLIASLEVGTVAFCPANGIPRLMVAVFGATVAIIGPGAISIDARLFGRKHIGS